MILINVFYRTLNPAKVIKIKNCLFQSVCGFILDVRNNHAPDTMDRILVVGLPERGSLAETPEWWSLEFQQEATLTDNVGHICREIDMYICGQFFHITKIIWKIGSIWNLSYNPAYRGFCMPGERSVNSLHFSCREPAVPPLTCRTAPTRYRLYTDRTLDSGSRNIQGVKHGATGHWVYVHLSGVAKWPNSPTYFTNMTEQKTCLR